MIVLKQAHLISPSEKIDGVGDLWLSSGKIVDIALEPKPIPQHAEVIDCNGKYIFSGMVDTLTFCGELGMQHREDFSSLSKSALRGGFTDVVVGPWGQPCTDNPAVVTDLRARSQSYPVRFHFLGALTKAMRGEALSEMGLMKQAGALGFTDGGHPPSSSSVLRRILQYAQRLQVPIFLRPADPNLEEEGVMHEGIVSTRIGLRGIPVASEAIGVSRIRALAKDTGAKVCIGPISSFESIQGVGTTDDVVLSTACRSLFLSDRTVEESGYNPNTHLVPPLRDRPDLLVQAAQDGQISMLMADHHPLTRVEKDMEFALSTPGALGLETALSVAYTALQDVHLLVELLVERPATLCGLSKGLQIGTNADIVIFDSTATWSPKAPYQSKGINEPLEGYSLRGRVIKTIIGEQSFSFVDVAPNGE